MLFGRRKPGYTTTVDAASDPEQVILDLYGILFFLALDRHLDIIGLGIKVDDRLNGPFLLTLETLGQGLRFLQNRLALGLDIGRWKNKVNRSM